MKIAGEIIGVLGIAVNFLIYQQKDRKKLLIVKLISDIAWALHYGLLTAFSGMAVCIVGGARETTFFLTENKKDKRKYFLIAFCLIACVTSALTMKDWFGLLPALASLIAVFSYWQQNPTLTKIFGVPISISMLVYDFMRFSIFGFINELIALISILIFFISKRFKDGKTTK